MTELERLGIGWGKARISVAVDNPRTSPVYPVETIRLSGSKLKRLRELTEEYEPELVYVGLLLTLSGEHPFAAQLVAERASLLAVIVPGMPLRLVDKRMSAAGASHSLGGASRNPRQQRRIIDQATVVEILQRALNLETASGRLAGESLKQEDL